MFPTKLTDTEPMPEADHQPKEYQKDVLLDLGEYLDRASAVGAAKAFT